MVELSTAEVKKSAAPIFKKYGIKRAQLFGSVATGKSRESSDIDILISFAKPTDGWTYARLARELEEALAHPVDLVTENALSDYVKPRIQSDLMLLYDEG